MEKATAPSGLRVLPGVVPISKLAIYVNMYLDRTDPSSNYGSLVDSPLNPFRSPCERVLVWGAPGVGKARTLDAIVAALGPDRALGVRGIDLADPDKFAQVTSFLSRAKRTGIPVVLGVTDFDEAPSNGGQRLFDEPTADLPQSEGDPDQPVDADDDLAGEMGQDSTQRQTAERLEHAIESLRSSGRSRRPHSGGSLTAQLPLSERLGLGGDLPPAIQILRAVQAEDVPALLIYSQSNPLAPDTGIGPQITSFEGRVYAPLPGRSQIRALWADVLESVPRAPDIDLDALAELSDGLTSDDLLTVVRKAVRTSYLANPRPLDDISVGQVDLLSAIQLPTFAFDRWQHEMMLADRITSVMSIRIVAVPKANPALDPDIERLSRGKQLRATQVPALLKEAALGELSCSCTSSTEGGWDALLNGGLG